MQIILVEPDKRLRDFFSVNLTQSLRSEVIPQESAAEAWGMIEILDASLIICKDKIEKENSVDFLIEKAAQEGKTIPIIGIGTDVNASADFLTLLPENTSPEALAKTAQALLEREKEQKDEEKKQKRSADLSYEYKPVPLNVFRYFAEFPYDIFIRLKRGDGFQFLKRIVAKEGYDLTMIDSYEAKNVTHLFIKKEHYDDFTDLANKRFKELLNDIHTNSKSKEEIQEFVLKQLTQMGFNSSNLDLACKSIEKINNKIKSADSKLKLINDIYKSSLGYRYRRSYMISVLGNLLIRNINWGETKHAEYITMAAYLHDMFLESDEEMEISSELELEQSMMTGQQRDRVETHAKLAADSIQSKDRIPSEVEKIVRTHHGSHSGSGFQNNISPQVQKLAIAFLAAEEFTLGILRSPRNVINVPSVIKEISEKYNQHKDVLECLDAIRSGLKK